MNPLQIALGIALVGASPVEVMYAGSLTSLFEKKVGPAFQAATGFDFRGEGKGSVAIANLIKGKIREPDVFVSADPKVNEALRGQANGGYVSWWVPFARTEMVLAFSAASRSGEDFEAARAGKRTWESVLEQPGVRLGRTDPELDPKGYRTLWVFELDEELTGEAGEARRILGPPDNPAQIFPEEQLVARLQAGQLDAGVFYLIEAVEAGLHHLALPPRINQGDPALAAHYARKTYTTRKGVTFTGSPIIYTVTIPSTARHMEGALAFVRYVLGEAGQALLAREGLRPVPPVLSGEVGALPAPLKSLVRSP